VGLQEVQEVAPGGMALVDAGGDLLILAGEEVEENDWTRFAINLLGLYQGAEGGVRISLRVVLHYLREKELAGTPLTDADVSTLIAHINATHPGEIDTYADALPGLRRDFCRRAERWARNWRRNWPLAWKARNPARAAAAVAECRSATARTRRLRRSGRNCGN
jgi:hypothetical protein